MTLRTICTALVVAVLAGVVLAQVKKTDASPIPGDKATWDVKAFSAYFFVVETEYRAKSKAVRWTLETKDVYRTADLVRDIDRDRPFTFLFRDEDGKELATVKLSAADFEGIPKDKLIKKGTQLLLTLEVPNVLDKTKTVELRRGAGK